MRSSREEMEPVEEEKESSGLRALLEEEDDDDDVDYDSMSLSSSARGDASKTDAKTESASVDYFGFQSAPEVVVSRWLAYLTPEVASRCALVCRDWRCAATSEVLAETLCRRAFKRSKAFRPDRWRGWRGMLMGRPRPRVGGFYGLRESKWRAVKQRDMFLPKELKGTFHVEVVWWRFFRFFDDGTVAYTLVNESDDKHPSDVAAYLLRKDYLLFHTNSNTTKRQRQNQHQQQRAYLGDYSLHPKHHLEVNVQLPHATMRFDLNLEHQDSKRFLNLRLTRFLQFDDPNSSRHIDHHLPDPPLFAFVPVATWG